MSRGRTNGGGQLLLHETVEAPRSTVSRESVPRAIESEDFPFERFADAAELESWRKEIHRPIYHIHKWWAQRLGSVFRAILIGASSPRGADVEKLFYEPTRLPGSVVFDPFMGSGTTIGEAVKLGARPVGRDINPVAHLVVRNALARHPRAQVVETYRAIERDVADRIRRFYRAEAPDGGSADVLYHFWVKVVPCPGCGTGVDLFSSYVFSRHAYAARHPDARAVCPWCGAINSVRFDADDACCAGCRKSFDPSKGPAKGSKATCPTCTEVFPIAKTVKALGRPPEHRLYAKLLLLPSGEKAYAAADESDRRLYEEASRELTARRDAYPVVPIEPGYNTNQALNYCYTHWHEMFNARQLLCLSILAERIRAIPEENLRGLFACLFSGVLEFNNMFASFKGEGTGAVRHMFSHHILKPERTPLEANVWGTPRSSGSFSTLFESRILRALDYAEDPFEIRATRRKGRLTSEKVYGLSRPIGHEAATTFDEFAGGKSLYLSCGDSSRTDIPDGSVDVVVTDPPFFDNVHYSQLADFFYVWQRFVLGANGARERVTTRSEAEVQQTDSRAFAERLGAVWTECCRVLKSNGLLVFSYHHSRAEGWRSVLESLSDAGFVVVAAHPMKAEMSVATPKKQAAEPIDLDIILVCRKRPSGSRSHASAPEDAVRQATDVAQRQIQRLLAVGRRLSRNDVRVVLTAQVIRHLSSRAAGPRALSDLDACEPVLEAEIDRLYERSTGDRSSPRAPHPDGIGRVPASRSRGSASGTGPSRRSPHGR